MFHSKTNSQKNYNCNMLNVIKIRSKHAEVAGTLEETW